MNAFMQLSAASLQMIQLSAAEEEHHAFDLVKSLVQTVQGIVTVPAGAVAAFDIDTFYANCIFNDVVGVSFNRQCDSSEFMTGLFTHLSKHHGSMHGSALRPGTHCDAPVARDSHTICRFLEQFQFEVFTRSRCQMLGCSVRKRLRNETMLTLPLPLDAKVNSLQSLITAWLSSKLWHDYPCQAKHDMYTTEHNPVLVSLPQQLLVHLGRNANDANVPNP